MNNQHNAKYAFYYLLSLAALIFMALSVGMIVFGIVNKTVVDALALSNYNFYDSQMRFAISALFISAPIFYFFSSLISRGLKKGELEKDSAIRRWLNYFILLVSSVIILGVFIGIINNFLDGELTLRFVFKAIAMLIISGITFSFYYYDIKRTQPEKKDIIVRIYFFASLILVIAAFVAAWFFVEAPKEARNRRLDQIVVNNIYSLESAVNTYYEKNKKLPESIEELKANKNYFLDVNTLIDPATKEAIVYNKLNDKGFEFCATFRTDSNTDSKGRTIAITYPGDNKSHRTGYQCLTGTLYAVEANPAEKVK